jgi:hypothetical protein
LTAEERAKLTVDVARWEDEVKKLEHIEGQQGFEAVHPMAR